VSLRCSDVFVTFHSYIYFSIILAKCTADVIIVLDTSISVGWSDFAHIQSFLLTLTDHVIDNLNVDSGRIPVGLLTYSSTVRPLFNLSLHTTVAPIQAAISSFSYSRGATNTAAALAYVRTTMLTSLAGARYDVPKVVIVLTDGKSSDPRATQVSRCVIYTSIHTKYQHRFYFASCINIVFNKLRQQRVKGKSSESVYSALC